ncbi:hypothetical protein HA402_000463 [Bradysia odoriphaga]|nr:hypothetical protein HA402_000463 [Bradysia odoriphaga]
MPALLFVIASSADYKLINRLLLHLRDWEFGEDPTWDIFHLVTLPTLPKTDAACTIPPITENDLSNNHWMGKSISDIETYILSERSKNNEGLNLNTFLILDEEGVKDGTIVLLDVPYSDDDNGIVERFNKVRVPWQKAYIMWCNLDIANMDFTDFVEDEDEEDVEWWKFTDFGETEEQVVTEKRNSAIAELEQKAMA